MTRLFQLFQCNGKRFQLRPDIIFFICIVEIIFQPQADSQFFKNPQSRFGLEQRLDNRLPEIDAAFNLRQRIVPFQVSRLGENHIGVIGGVVHQDIGNCNEIQFGQCLQGFATVGNRAKRILAIDEPAVCLVRLPAENGIPQILEYSKLQGYRRIFPRNTVQTQCPDAWIWRLRNGSQLHSTFLTFQRALPARFLPVADNGVEHRNGSLGLETVDKIRSAPVGMGKGAWRGDRKLTGDTANGLRRDLTLPLCPLRRIIPDFLLQFLESNRVFGNKFLVV